MTLARGLVVPKLGEITLLVFILTPLVPASIALWLALTCTSGTTVTDVGSGLGAGLDEPAIFSCVYLHSTTDGPLVIVMAERQLRHGLACGMYQACFHSTTHQVADSEAAAGMRPVPLNCLTSVESPRRQPANRSQWYPDQIKSGCPAAGCF